MLKGKKGNPKGVQKFNKNIKKVGDDSPKQKKQQLQKVKELVKATLKPEETPTQILAEKDAPDDVEQSEDESNVANDASDAVVQSGVESDEEDDASDAIEQSGVESDEEDDAPDAVEQSEAENREEKDGAPDAVEKSKPKRDGKGTKKANCPQGVGHTVLVSNLPAKTNRVQLVTLFAPYGKIMSILFSTSKGIIFTHIVPAEETQAYVVLDSIEAANKALDVNGTLLNGRKLIVKKPDEPFKFVSKYKEEDTVVFVTNLKTKKKESLGNFFSSCGKIKYINFIKNYDDDKVKAFVCFTTPEAVNLALKLNGNMLDDGQVRIARYSPNFKSSKIILKAGELKNLDKDEFKEKMLKLGQKRIQQMQRNSFKGERMNSQFRGVKSRGIKRVKRF